MKPELKKVGMLSKFSRYNLQERDCYEDLGIDGLTILEWILMK